MQNLTADQIDKDLEPVLRGMEEIGIKLDVAYLTGLAERLADQIISLEEQIVELAGRPFAVSSPKQLSTILFDELRLGESDGFHLRKKKTGFSTAASELEKLRDSHPIIPLVLEYRELSKLLPTYVLPLPQLVDADERLHTHYAPDAASGRLSSRKPNLQNIPIRTEVGRTIRRAFVAETGWQLLEVDYSQVQLRIMAHLSGDQTMLEVFRAGGDIHTKTSEALGVDRRTAKAVNFGIIYGLTGYGLAESLGVLPAEAQAFIDGFLSTYPAVATYMQELIAQATQSGYSETLYGKRRALPELASKNDFLRRAAERIALNHPIQGTEAEIIKLAMIELARVFADATDIRMILQVHDELVFEVQPSSLDQRSAEIKTIMEQVVSLSTPLPVEMKVGPNWAEMELLELKNQKPKIKKIVD